eukprot:SAG22_NODE_31_length_27697_cov_7.384376_19_plen_552_part_00
MGNGSLGVAGRPGEWFSFEPKAALSYVEIRLLAETSDAAAFSSTIAPDIFDGHGDRVPTLVPPTLHSRRDGSMLRWNISAAGSAPFFVRATANAQHSVAVASPLPYRAELVATETSANWSAAQSLEIAAGEAVAVRLPFAFEFYGVAYERMWVSAAGLISFEEQHSGSFADAGSSHTAVLVCGAEFQLDKSEAAVTMMQADNELQVRWRGALFNSSELSDVSLSLYRDGSLWIEWTTLHLSRAGSLESGLAAWSLSDLPQNSSSLHDGAQVVISSDPSGTTGTLDFLGSKTAGVGHWQASARLIPIDVSRYFSPSAILRRYSENGSLASAPSPYSGALSSDIMGMGIAQLFAATLTGCQARCSEDVACQAVQFTPDESDYIGGFNCFLHDNQEDSHSQWQSWETYKKRPEFAQHASTLCDEHICAGQHRRQQNSSNITTTSHVFIAVSNEAGCTYEAARARCKAQGYTDLASIHSTDEMKMAEAVCGHLSYNSNRSVPCFIGLHTNKNEQWEWSDSSSTGWITEQWLDGSGSWGGLGQHGSNSTFGNGTPA